jgi:hypothetical protein
MQGWQVAYDLLRSRGHLSSGAPTRWTCYRPPLPSAHPLACSCRHARQVLYVLADHACTLTRSGRGSQAAATTDSSGAGPRSSPIHRLGRPLGRAWQAARSYHPTQGVPSQDPPHREAPHQSNTQGTVRHARTVQRTARPTWYGVPGGRKGQGSRLPPHRCPPCQHELRHFRLCIQ